MTESTPAAVAAATVNGDELPAGDLPRRARRGWWRRNLLPLLVLAAVLPATVYVVLGLPVLEILGREPTPTVVPAGDSAEAAGYEWTVLDSAEFVGTGGGDGDGANAIPLGTSIVAALVQATPLDGASDVPVTCQATLTDRGSRVGERTWAPLVDLDQYDYVLGADTTTLCDPATGEPFVLEVVFLTPTGTYEGATVDIALSASGLTLRDGTLLRFPLGD
ncbi:MAG TPA: hypothetical protein VIL55_09345 [Naasia sp.]|jgi:hypothetical protein